MSNVAGKKDQVRAYLLESAETKREVSNRCLDSIVAASELIAGAFRSGSKVLLCGNGGSAADCQHLATEFVSRLTSDFDRPGLPAIAGGMSPGSVADLRNGDNPGEFPE